MNKKPRALRPCPPVSEGPDIPPPVPREWSDDPAGVIRMLRTAHRRAKEQCREIIEGLYSTMAALTKQGWLIADDKEQSPPPERIHLHYEYPVEAWDPVIWYPPLWGKWPYYALYHLFRKRRLIPLYLRRIGIFSRDEHELVSEILWHLRHEMDGALFEATRVCTTLLYVSQSLEEFLPMDFGFRRDRLRLGRMKPARVQAISNNDQRNVRAGVSGLRGMIGEWGEAVRWDDLQTAFLALLAQLSAVESAVAKLAAIKVTRRGRQNALAVRTTAETVLTETVGLLVTCNEIRQELRLIAECLEHNEE